ncbi:killer cell lectin-like receptor subfamily B member 1 isoform X2 [Dromaius novaehollandiae]|uniref:Killer cell lectin-like receptor subfamily B member 1 n=1 Tax=Dromaius novaehollandiae TaxID=8790 RepID=A0A8C4P4E7_DRONO
MSHSQATLPFSQQQGTKKGAEGGKRMSENLTYAGLNVAELNRSRLQKDTDIPGCVYAEVKVKSLDTSAVASYKAHGPTGQADMINSKDGRRGKSCFSRTCVAVLIAMIVFLLLALGLGLILMFLRTQKPPAEQESPIGSMSEERGCPSGWIRNRKKCYFFSQSRVIKDWDTYRQECKEIDSDLVIINNREELEYLFSKSKGHYYLLGLKYSGSERKWKWINGTEHRTDIFKIAGKMTDYFCTVIGFDQVATASCNGSSTTQNMCEKAANISALPKMAETET